MIRVPSRWIPVFLIVVPVGDSLVTNTVKGIIDRARPTIDPAAATLGPSFPSGHSSTAAAFFAALALLAWRRRPAHVRNVLAGAAVGIAVAVACSRVLLDLHWLSDVVAGLALGWAWFAVCAVAFGGTHAAVRRAGRGGGAAPAGRASARGRLGALLIGDARAVQPARGRAAAAASRHPRRPPPGRSPPPHGGRPARGSPIELSNVGPAAVAPAHGRLAARRPAAPAPAARPWRAASW